MPLFIEHELPESNEYILTFFFGTVAIFRRKERMRVSTGTNRRLQLLTIAAAGFKGVISDLPMTGKCTGVYRGLLFIQDLPSRLRPRRRIR